MFEIQGSGMLSHFVNSFRSGYIFQNKPTVPRGDIRNVNTVCTWSFETIRKAEMEWFTCYKLILCVYERGDQLSASDEIKHVSVCVCSEVRVFFFVSGEKGVYLILLLHVKYSCVGLKLRTSVTCLSTLKPMIFLIHVLEMRRIVFVSLACDFESCLLVRVFC